MDPKYISVEYEPKDYVPDTMKDFVEFIESDHWNQMIFQEILLRQKKIKDENLVRLKLKTDYRGLFVFCFSDFNSIQYY